MLKMEEESVSLINYVPSFARGINLLLIHDDTLSLVYLSSLLQKYSFKVTTTDDTSAAASMICDHEGRFKLIMAKASMPGMDALSFLDVVLEKDIPVIFIYSGGFDHVTQKALATGSCYFLEEPISSNDLKYIWQHVYHSKTYSFKETQNADSQDKDLDGNGLQHTKIKQCQVYGANGKGNHDDKGGKLKEKRAVDDQTMPGLLIATECQVHRANRKRNHDDDGGMPKENRTVDNHTTPGSWSSAQMNFCYVDVYPEKRRVWTPELHLKFTEAVRVLGENDARPKQILSFMNEPYLTVRQVSSHLQKYKARLKRNASKYDLPPVSTSSCSSDRTQFPSLPEGSSLGTKDLPAPSACLNESQNQNQFLMNYDETQDSEILKLPETTHSPTFPADELTNSGSQSLDSTVEHPVPAASSTDQDQPAPEFDVLMKMIAEDCDSFDWFGNGTNLDDEVDQYSEMLKTVLDGDSFNPSEFDIDNPNRS